MTRKQRTREAGAIERVLIIGGGTAGWMSAVFLRRLLGPEISITLVESKAIGTIGVGEASFNNIKNFFDYVEIPEHEWMPACDATYKLAIRFEDWSGPDTHFYHPFEQPQTVADESLLQWWLTLDSPGRFDYDCFVTPTLCDRKLSPKFPSGGVFDRSWRTPYGYHFDAGLLADFLRTTALKRGVHHHFGEVADVAVTEDGAIESVSLSDGPILRSDLFLDCTGFRGLLVNGALGEPFESFLGALPCDRAVAFRLPRDPSAVEINPYTTATALSAGWSWDIPLYRRDGVGYVYSSRFLDAQAAEAELLQHRGVEPGEHEALHLKMRPGRTRRPWLKNCLAVGLSAGFVEPLESTGLFFIHHALIEFAEHFPTNRLEPRLIESYNERIYHCIQGVRDFLVLHYAASGRTDTAFWRAAHSEREVSEWLHERLELWYERLPTRSTVSPWKHGFLAYSYAVMVLGLGKRPDPSPVLDESDRDDALARLALLAERADRLAVGLPSHHRYLRFLYEDGLRHGPDPRARTG